MVHHPWEQGPRIRTKESPRPAAEIEPPFPEHLAPARCHRAERIWLARELKWEVLKAPIELQAMPVVCEMAKLRSVAVVHNDHNPAPVLIVGSVPIRLKSRANCREL